MLLVPVFMAGDLVSMLVMLGAAFRDDLRAPLPSAVRAVAIYSRSDGIVSWRACLDPCAEHVEAASSHVGMSVNVGVYRELARILEQEANRWTG